MLTKRLIPILLLDNESLVKTVNFKNPIYIGDPLNTSIIFNNYKVDELIILDISLRKKLNDINYQLLKEISNKCFMPLSYGGGVSDITQATNIIKLGFEKIVINYNAIKNKSFISDLANKFGNQSVIVSIDYKKKIIQKELFIIILITNMKLLMLSVWPPPSR